MSLSNDQLLDRIVAIENKLNQIQIAMNKLATKAQMKALLQIRQSEIDDLQTEVADLKVRVADLES